MNVKIPVVKQLAALDEWYGEQNIAHSYDSEQTD